MLPTVSSSTADVSFGASVGTQKCVHCGLLSSRGRFCCRGCEFVYSLLQEKHLTDFYRIRDKSGSVRKSRPAPDPSLLNESLDPFSYLDDKEFVELYAVPVEGSSDKIMQFYLEGVHCTACVWLTEKVAEWVDDVRNLRLDLGRSIATVRVLPGGSFARVARELMNLGYRPHPVKQDEAWKLETRENRRALVRLAIAGAAAGNIMLLAISVYAGATGTFARSFEWISFLICLPVATYCAWPFYKSAWGAMRSRELSIDIPIALGLGIAFIASIVSLLIEARHIYFDTISALVFLLLASRYVLRKTQQEAIHASRLVYFLTPSRVRRRAQDHFEEVKVDELRNGDRVLVLAGECLPADGVVRSGTSTLDCSLLTGEPRLELVQSGAQVYAGTLNQQAPLEVEVQASASATRLGKILQSMEENLSRKAPIVAFTDSIAKAFVLVSLALVAVAFGVGMRTGIHEAVSRALAMAIVACPCAFAFATPLALSVVLGRCAKNGILIKGPDVLEKLAHIDHVILDKTGTLTVGHFEVTNWMTRIADPADAAAIERAVYALESRSTHPIAQAICRFLEQKGSQKSVSIEIADFREQIGRGVSGTVEGSFYSIRSWTGSEGSDGRELELGTHLAVERDGHLLGRIVLQDTLRPNSKKAIEALKKQGYRVTILSGDSRPGVLKIAKQLGILSEDAISSASPEDKSKFVEVSSRALMVGDGANDAVALASAYVSVAVHSSLEISMRAADIYQSAPGIMPVVRLITVARETLRVIHRNFAFSLVYNVIGAVAAISGKVDPLFAAVLMPISALTVFGSSIIGTRKLRGTLKQELTS